MVLGITVQTLSVTCIRIMTENSQYLLFVSRFLVVVHVVCTMYVRGCIKYG